MTEVLIEFVSGIPPHVGAVVLSALPLTELRLSIPVAIHAWGVDPFSAYGLALIGNALPFFPLFFGLRAFRDFSEKHIPWLTRFIDSSVARAEERVKEKYARYGAFALFLFTAIPLPMTGLYTATLAAVALRVPFRHALIGTYSGITVAGILVTLASIGFL